MLETSCPTANEFKGQRVIRRVATLMMNTNSKRSAIVLSALVVLWLLFTIIFNLEIVTSSWDQLGDFGSFIASGLFLKDGKNPYSTTSPLIFEVFFPRVNAGGKMPNLNPPISLLAFEWISTGDPIVTVNIWRLLSLLLYVASFLLLANEYKPSPLRTLWAFALAGLWHTIGLGQIYTLLLLLTTLAWLSSRRNQFVATGIFIGLLVSIKPNFILWVLLLASQKNWKSVLGASLAIIICAAIPLARMSPEVYSQWLEAAQVDSHVLMMPGNSSLLGLTSRMGIPQVGAILGLLFLGITFLAVYRSRDITPNPEALNSTGVFLSLLISPISWVGYTILTLPYFLSQRRWGYSTLIAAAILTLPFNFTMYFYYQFGKLNFIFWGWWYGIALTICFCYTLFRIWRGTGQTKMLEIPQS
ncbi:MAG: glycosyltransferase family 87 protein [Chloroflexota bacterium]